MTSNHALRSRLNLLNMDYSGLIHRCLVASYVLTVGPTQLTWPKAVLGSELSTAVEVTTASGGIPKQTRGEPGRVRDDLAGWGDGGSLLDKYTFRATVKTVIEEEHLPDLPAFLEGIGLGEKLDDCYRKSVFETKYLFTLNDMDLRLMGLSPEEASTMKVEVAKLKVEREVTEERLHPLLARRNELTYGRLFLDGSVSSFEFYLAGFGPPAPADGAKLVWAEPRNACRPPSLSGSDGGGVGEVGDGVADLSEMFVVAVRGDCSFIDKANNVAKSNAAAMVLVNAGDDCEELFRVSATLGGRSGGEKEPTGPKDMATVLVRGSALPSIAKALEWGSVTAKLVPLECKPGKAACEALLPEERDADLQVDSGTVSLMTPDTSDPEWMKGAHDSDASFDFLSATFGATLPRDQVLIVPSLPMDACAPLETPLRGVSYSHAGVLVRRGGCSFGVKAKHVQEAGGRVVVVADDGLGALQNVGAPDPLAKELYTPGVFVTARAGDYLFATAADALMSTKEGVPEFLSSGIPHDSRESAFLSIQFDPDNGVGKEWTALGMTIWPDEQLEQRVLARQLEATHAGSSCRSQWIKDKLTSLQGDFTIGMTSGSDNVQETEEGVPHNEAFSERSSASNGEEATVKKAKEL